MGTLVHKVHKPKPATRRGFSTGACAQAAVRAAALSATIGRVPCETAEAAGESKSREDSCGAAAGEHDPTGSVRIVLPGGEGAVFTVFMHERGVCSVIKDAGDDPDVTNGIRVVARVTPRRDGRFIIDGAEGVGRVTREGLPVKPGRPAINPAPLRAIEAEARAVLPGGADIVLAMPGGERLAARTFNPRLGIIGGLSILGTTGRVEPWSTAAYQESLLPQLDVARAAGIRKPVLVPGAKGEKAALRAGCDPAAVVQAGNFFGMMLAAARERGFMQVVLAGHVSKLAKIARGDFDTHSRRSGMPLDVLADSARAVGLSASRAEELKRMPTTEAAIRRLVESGDLQVLDETARRVAARISQEYGLQAEVILSDAGGATVGVSEQGLAKCPGVGKGV